MSQHAEKLYPIIEAMDLGWMVGYAEWRSWNDEDRIAFLIRIIHKAGEREGYLREQLEKLRDKVRMYRGQLRQTSHACGRHKAHISKLQDQLQAKGNYDTLCEVIDLEGVRNARDESGTASA